MSPKAVRDTRYICEIEKARRVNTGPESAVDDKTVRAVRVSKALARRSVA